MLAFQAFDANVRAQPDYLPFVAAAGMFLLEADDIAELNFYNHTFLSQNTALTRFR